MRIDRVTEYRSQGDADALEAIGHMCGVQVRTKTRSPSPHTPPSLHTLITAPTHAPHARQGRKELAGGDEDIWSLGELLLYGLKVERSAQSLLLRRGGIHTLPSRQSAHTHTLPPRHIHVHTHTRT